MKKGFVKLLAMVLTLLVVFSLAGCTGKNSNVEKKALLVVSFGTSFIESRELAIDATENVIKNAFPDYDFFRAFTSQIIIDIYADRDNVQISNVNQAIESIYKSGYGEVLVVPTLIINGEEEEEMMEALDPFMEKFENITVSTPLLSSYEDYITLVRALEKELPQTDEKEAVVLLGHGTHHDGNSAYGALDYVFKDEGFANVFVGTVEGFPTYETVLKKLKESGYEKITMMPAMLVAGDHAHNDMAGDEGDSWLNLFKSEGFDVEYIMKGLGELGEIQDLFVEHAKNALENK